MPAFDEAYWAFVRYQQAHAPPFPPPTSFVLTLEWVLMLGLNLVWIIGVAWAGWWMWRTPKD